MRIGAYEPHRLPDDQRTTLCIPPPIVGLQTPDRRLSQVSDCSFAARCPASPRWAERLHVMVASSFVLASASPRQPGHPQWCFEARAQFNLAAYGSLLRCPAPSDAFAWFLARPASLPALRYLHATGRNYMSNHQFTWQPPFRLLEQPASLAHRGTRGATGLAFASSWYITE